MVGIRLSWLTTAMFIRHVKLLVEIVKGRVSPRSQIAHMGRGDYKFSSPCQHSNVLPHRSQNIGGFNRNLFQSACSSEKDAKKIEQQVVGVRESERTAVILFIKQKLVPVCQILVYCMIDLN